MTVDPPPDDGREEPRGFPYEDRSDDAERLRLILRLRKSTQQLSMGVLVWDALLGVALGVLVVVVFALAFKPLQWLAVALSGL
jgi:hypothetical protein